MVARAIRSMGEVDGALECGLDAQPLRGRALRRFTSDTDLLATVDSSTKPGVAVGPTLIEAFRVSHSNRVEGLRVLQPTGLA